MSNTRTIPQRDIVALPRWLKRGKRLVAKKYRTGGVSAVSNKNECPYPDAQLYAYMYTQLRLFHGGCGYGCSSKTQETKT